jgi:hypothetical protein
LKRLKSLTFHARSIRSHLFWTYAALGTVLVVALMVLAELAASRIVLDGAQRELEQLGRRTQEQLLRFQEPARAWLEATGNDPRAGRDGENDFAVSATGPGPDRCRRPAMRSRSSGSTNMKSAWRNGSFTTSK